MKSRVNSIDILRGIIILLMIFVNDLASVANVPIWMKHAVPGSNSMTLVDLVFPAFLFIVGMSMPFAFDARRNKGDSTLEIFKHIVIRSINLIIIGIFMVNSYSHSKNHWLPVSVYVLLIYMFIIFTWNREPQNSEKMKSIFNKLKYVGIVGLIALVFIFRSDSVESIIELRTKWWGILGLIGWAYMISSIFFIVFPKNKFALLGSMGFLYCFFFACEAEFLQNTWLRQYIIFSSVFGSHSAIVISGAISGLLIQQYHSESKLKCFKANFLFSIGLFLCGIMLNQLSPIYKMFTIDKIMATPTFSLLSASFTIWIWLAIYFIVDIKGKINWSKFLQPAGMNPLFAYILAPILMAVLELFNEILGFPNFYYMIGKNFYAGFARAILFALLITWLTGFFKNKEIWLKL